VRGSILKGVLMTRLVTRTKESRIRASRWVSNPMGVMKVKCGLAHMRCDPLACAARGEHRPATRLAALLAFERVYWDPKDGELCLIRVRPEATLVEARSGSNVQIDRRIMGIGAKHSSNYLVAGSHRSFPPDSRSFSTVLYGKANA